ncbi:hypothetical protein RSAG8_08308, partial [Rhizoctonia solani AG-8 WAC10335]
MTRPHTVEGLQSLEAEYNLRENPDVGRAETLLVVPQHRQGVRAEYSGVDEKLIRSRCRKIVIFSHIILRCVQW